MTGMPYEGFVSKEMQHGTDTEPEARAAYSFLRGVDVEEVGFVDHPTIPMTGASPDGYAGEDGLVEIKCPNTATHIEHLLSNQVPDKYIIQMQWQISCTGRQWCDFVSYDPRMPQELRLWVKRVTRDPKRILSLEDAVTAFLGEVDDTVKKLQALKEVKK
jgi:putative phage-type endonuclease